MGKETIKLHTIEALLKQVERQLPELMDEINPPHSIDLNSILIKHVKPSLTTIGQILKKIEENDKAI